MNSSDSNALLIVISGPSGVGKTTITQQLVKRLDAKFSVSMTTRPMAGSDREGEDYFFVDDARFRQAIENRELLEWAEVFGRWYGTPRQPVQEHLAGGRDVILEIDVAGGKQVKSAYPQALSIFFVPPSLEDLVDRLRGRGREDEQEIQRRYRDAKREIDEARSSGAYDHFVENNDLKTAIEKSLALILKRKQEA